MKTRTPNRNTRQPPPDGADPGPPICRPVLVHDADERAATPAVELVDRWHHGSQDAATELHERYVGRLVTLAKRHLNEKFSSRVDPDDLVQSIFRSVFRVTRSRHMEFTDDTGFWKWLVTVALNKTYKTIQRLDAARCTPDAEVGNFDELAHHPGRTSAMPTTAEVVELSDLFETILKSLEPLDQQILQLRLEGHSQQEIAERLLVDTRTVRRHTTQLRSQVAEIVGGDQPPTLD